MNKELILDQAVQEENLIIWADHIVEHCCEEMAEEIYENPYKNYTYLDEGCGIERYMKKKDDHWESLPRCPFCRTSINV